MLRNYFKIALRNIYKNKIYSFINIAGLAIGLACFILISIYIKNELNYDTFHANADRIYRPVEIQHPIGVGTQHVAVTMGPLAPAMKQDFPEIIDAVRFFRMRNVYFKIGDNGYYEDQVSFVDPQVFDIFTIPLLEGDSKTVLRNPNDLVLSRDIAKKFFGDQDPLGKIITVSHYWGTEEFTVAGVMKNYPANSNLEFEVLGSYSNVESKLNWLHTWGTNTLATYILVKPGTDIKALQAKLPAFVEKYKGDEDPERRMGLYLQPLKDIHLHSGHIVYQTFRHNQGDINNIYLFSIIAIFILLIACINFMNLATARSAKRAKEVGIRKVLGSNRKQLIFQFLGESFIFSFIALFLAVLLVELVYPYFTMIFPDKIIFSYTRDWGFMLQLIGLTFVVGFVAGSYPAFFLSRFQPAETQKGSFFSNNRGVLLRKVLVVFQFAIAIALIASTGIVRNQMNYIHTKDLGYNKNQVVYLPLRSREVRSKLPLIENELRSNSNIINVSATAGLTGAGGSQGTMHAAGSDEEAAMMMRYSEVDYDYVKTMEMKIMQGRDFSRNIASDSTTSVLVNETAVREFGWKNPLGKQFRAGEGEPNLQVIGVVNDYNFYSLHQKIEPLIMWINRNRCNYLVARISPHDIPATINFIQKTWNRHFPAEPVEISFLDKHFGMLYQADQNTSRLFTSFSMLAVLIGCLGLFGLASFTVEQKTKEIGIRKVLGASIGSIIFLLTKEFIKWVTVACIIGFPLAYFASQDWLNNFVYRTGVHYTTFIIAGLIALLIAVTTVSFQAVKASLANPVESLRYE
ncbi:MAG: ABC transporter permease [Calditrichia bacterium]